MYTIITVCDKCDLYEVHFDHILNIDIIRSEFPDYTYECNILVFRFYNGYIKYLKDILIFEKIPRSIVEKISKKLDLIA